MAVSEDLSWPPRGKSQWPLTRGTMIEYKDEKGKWHHERQPWNKGGTVDRPKHLIVYIPNCLVELLNLIKPANAQETDYIFAVRPSKLNPESSPERN